MKNERIEICVWIDRCNGVLFGIELGIHITSLRSVNKGSKIIYLNVHYYTNKKNEFELPHVTRKRVGSKEWTVPYFKEE